ncbi:cell division protein FtsL [Thermoclostridium stercorarium subsp. stercorarium DSM 8532]|jgi:cell division protein FtsL|uniref:Cell division protein FtsL n=3 Tax=Thermoclostridium stercorarium TaxID=1510 RepID=L7VUA9_THES1|nr:cell division protein FtsL [Thermoclostridium stercorarium]AGC69148.1 cell division protein FtsL [Thermoclostridium stercorarium subsp. stercorarium DSM 8532]AGI40117.1 septum formation initiator [Thermoclostridium stercorarium subsp. stercorarium DSM 8532]ANW99430.1 cell division protein FtsL [Thermoclostridium stercorarium subsp. thermolacticum DSM 2910]ANX02056.1 cell division protein FtsL [Thermoclostridium stercorarium subsp. leptospartum DSM 9219]UZQ85116.1 cell division protein FtsL 
MKEKYYVYGSAAPKLNEQPYPRKRQRTVRKTTPVPSVAAKPVTAEYPVVQIIVCIVITFAVFFTIIYRYSTITEMNYKLSALNKEYESLKDSNRKLEVSINSKINQENIRKIAEERLNMKMPDSYQKIPVKVPKVNYSTVNLEEEKEKESFWKSMLMFFGEK